MHMFSFFSLKLKFQIHPTAGSSDTAADASEPRQTTMASATERCLPPADIAIETEARNASSPTSGTESPGASQLSPPPSYHDIPGTVPAHRGVSRGPPPSYEDAVDPNGEICRMQSADETARYKIVAVCRFKDLL